METVSLTLPERTGFARIEDAFCAAATRYPERIALSEGSRTLSYRELDALTNRVAARIGAHGLGMGDIVGLALPRGLQAVVAMLAVLKAGCAYLPLGGTVDCDWSSRSLDAAGARAILAPAAEGGADVLPRLSLRRAEAPGHPARLAYVMFTSGTTGEPKGVMVPHEAVLRLFERPHYVALGPETVMGHAAPLEFDASTFEIWGALLTGGRLAILSGPALDPGRLERFVADERVTTLWLTAGLFHTFARHRPRVFAPLRTLLTGGDVVRGDRVQEVMDACPRIEVVNGYGPTENTTFTSCHRMRPGDRVAESVPIGRAVSGTGLHVLDAALCRVSHGVEGALYCSGAGLALGYLGNGTEDAFLSAPWDPRLRVYRTGDRVVMDASGCLHFRGRSDDQVKIRGRRVNLQDLRRALLRLDGVSEAVAAMEPDETGNRLVARIEAMPGKTYAQIREGLERLLPPHAMPDRITFCDALRLTGNGKLDRAGRQGRSTLQSVRG